MASDNEACVNDPNFAVICSFFNKFGKICGVQLPKVKDLQAMLEQSQEVHPALIDLHVKLLRKARRTVHLDKWERALVKFIHTYSNQDAWNLEHLGYKKLKLPQRLFILKNLLEMQFDNAKFKNALLQSSADDLRLEPIGKDKKGNSYWYQVDEDCNLRVYKENLDEESWTLVAQTREELADLISTLGGLEKNGSNTTSNEDSNSIATINSLLTSKNNDDSITNDTIKIVSATDKSKSKETEDSEEFLSPDDEDNYFDDDIVNDNAKDGMDDDKKEKKINGNGVKSCVNNSYENKARSKKRKCKSLSEEDHSVNKKMKKDVSDIINDEPTSSNNSDESEYGAAIEEPVMIVTGQGSGVDCDAGNPGESGTAENSLSDTKEVRNDSTTQSVQDSSTDVETALKSPDDEQNSGESLIISDTNVKERKPLMYFGQPGCLKLNPVMVRTAGHANFLNTNYSKIQDKVDVCNANDNKALTTNCSDLDKSHSGQDIADSVSLSNKSNEYAMDTKVGDEESIFLSKGNNITFNNDSLNEKSLSESFINKSLNETTFSTLLYEVTNLSIITPNASIASIESSLIDDSKSALNKSEIVSSNSTDDRTSTASISPKLKECDNEGYLKIDNTSENIQDQQSITLKSNLEEDISNLNETKKDFLSIKTTIAHDEKPKDKEHNKSSAFFVEVEANVININLNTGLDTQTELISVEKESLEKKCDKDSPQNDLLKNKNINQISELSENFINNLNEHDTVLDSISEKNIKLSSNIDLISKSTEDISTVKCDECNSTNKILINEKEKKEKAVNEDFLEVVTDTDVKSEKIKEESEMIEFKSTVDTENGLLLSETNISTKEHKDVQRISEILSHTTVENVDQAHSVNLNVNDSNEIDNNLNSHEILQKEPTSCFNNEIVKTTELNLQNETNRVGLINCEFSSANTKYNTLIGDDNKIQNITSFGHKEANQDEHIEQSDVCIEKIYETTQYKKEEQILGKEVTKTSEDHIEGISNEENLKTSMICSDNKNIKFVSDASISEIDKSKEVCTNTLKETAEKEPTNKKPVEFIAGVMEDSQNNLLKKENIKNIICATMKSEIKNVTDGCNTKIISKCNKNFNSSEELVKSRDPEGEKIKIILDKDSSVENKSSEKGNGNHECKETDLILEKSEQLTNTLIANKDSMEIESDALKQNNCLSNTITKNQENDSNKFFLASSPICTEIDPNESSLSESKQTENIPIDSSKLQINFDETNNETKMPLENNLEDTVGIVDISSSVSTSKQINLEENENENNFHDKSVEADKVDINKQNANDKCHTPIPTSINLECDNNDQCKLSLSGKSEVVSQDNPLLKLPKECQTLENKDSDIFDETSKINQNSDSEIVKPIANADDFSRSDTKHKDYCDNSQTKSFIVKPRNETKDNIENILDNLHKPYDSLENTVTVKDTDTLYNAENKDSISLDGATIQNKMFLDNNEVSPQLADSKENTLVDHSTITNDDNLRHLNKIHSEVQHEENSKSITISCNFDSSKNITTTDKVDVKDEVLNSETFVKNSVHSCPQSVVGENSIISNNNDTTLENQEISEQARKDCGENLKLCLVSEEVSDQKKMIKNETSQDFNKTEEYVVNVNTESKLVSTENIIETDPNNFEKNISGLTELHEKEAKLAVKSDKAKKEKLLEDSTDDNLILNNTCEAKIFICESVTDIEKPSKIHEKEDLLNKDADTHQSSNNIIEVQSINKTVDTSESADVFELKTSMVDKDSVHEIPKNENVEIKEGSLGIEQRDSQEHEKVDAHLNVEHVSIVRASDKDELLQTKIEVVEESNIASNKSSQLNDIENRKQNDDIPLISELVVPCTNTVPHSLENDQVSNEDNFMVNDIIISNSCLIKSKNKNDQIEIGKEIEKDAESDSKLVTHGEEKLITSTAIDINKTEVTSHENVIEKNCDKSDIISTTTDNDNEKLELKVISEKQSEQKLEKEIEILDDKEATKFDIKEMKGEKVLDTNILSIKEQENQSTIGDQNQLDISKNKDLLKEELLEYNTPAEETHTGGKKSIDDVNELDLSVKIVGPSMESEEKCLKSEMTEVSVKLDDANMQESSAPRSTDACIFDESNKTMDESMQKQDDKNFKTDVHNKKELKTVNLSLTQESIKENVDKKEEMEEENKDNTEVVQDLKCKLKDQNSDLSKLDTKLESQKNATMKIALKSSECQENSINIAKNILSIDNFDIESSPLKCTIVDSTISEIIDYSKGKVDDITTPLAAKHTNPDTKNTLINKDDSNSEHAAHEYEKLDSDTEFPEASISDEEIVQEDPLADPLAGTIDVVDDTSKADEENQQASLTGSIRVRNIKDLKIESAAKPNTRKRRISDKVEDSVESVGNISSDEECGGKRLKMRGRRSNVAKRKVAVHNKSKPQKEASSSDEEEEIDAKAKPNEKTKTTEDNSKGKKNKVKKHDESEKKGNKTGINKNIEPDRKRTKTRRIMGLVVDEDAIISKHDESNVRQSRRIAQIKIKEEAERRKVEEITLTHLKQESQKKRKSKNDDKEFKVEKRKRKQQEESSSESEPESHSCDVRQDKKKKRGRRRKQTSKPAFDETKPWQSSSESSSEKDGEEDDIEFEHYHSEDDNIPVIKSDHEFSPESDLEGGESQPTRRARTAKKESEEAEICDDQRCQKCGKSDQPEWILLCDECDHGYHCSCLKPVLFIIPEGDWYCPPCQQKRLIINLQMQLVEFDKLMKRKEEEDLRKERLAIAGVNEENSMDNEGNPKHSKEDESESSSSEETSSSGSTDSEEDESGYKLRERRAANVCYRFNDYDDLINKAIKDEMDVAKESAGNMGRGKDISTIIEAENEKKADNEVKEESIQKDEEKQIIEKEAKTIESGSEYDEKSECKDKTQSDDSSSNSDSERLNQLQVLSKRKKQRKLNALDVSSEEDHVSDEDFKGSSADSEDEDLESNSDFSDSELDLPRKKGATRRSTRARMTRFDKAFINDSDDSSDAPKRKKKYKSILSDEDEESMSSSSEDSTTGWKSGHKRGYKKSKAPVRKMPKFPTVNKSESAPAVNKKPKKKRTSEISDLSFRSGGLKKSNDLDEPMEGRRTRGRKINYVEALASDSDEDKKKKKKTTVKKIVSEDEYVPVEEDNVATNPNTKEFDIEGQDKIDTAFIKNENIPKSDLLINALTKTPQTVAQVDRHVAALDERENLKKDADILNSITMADSSHGKPSTLTLSKLHEKVTSNKNFNTHIGGKTPLVVRNPNLLDDRSSLPKVARVDTSFEESGDCIDEEEEESIDEEEEEFDEEDIHEENEYMDSNKSKIEESEDVIAQRMMEDPDFAAMRLQQVGVQIAKDKKKKAAEEKKMLKEQRKLERIRKRDEKAKIKEERAKEREEKKLAKQAALAALAASPVERKKPGRKPKALTVASQNQQISDSGELHLSVSEKQVNAPSSSILSNRLNPNIPIQSQAAGTGFNLGSISVTPIKTLSAVQNQPATSDNVKVLSPMMSNPSSPCTSSSMSNTSTPGVVSGTSPVPNPQNFSLANLRPQNMNVPHAGQHLMTSQSTNVRHPLTPQTNAGFMGMGMPGLQNIPTTPKRRGRGRGKKAAAAAEAAANQLVGRSGNKHDEKGVTNLSIAAPPQPFSASQPSPSVITRMLHNPGGNPPVSINPTAPVTCDSNMPTGSVGLTTSPSSFQGKYYPHSENYLQRPRGPMGAAMGIYRPAGPMGNYPPRGMYHSPHHPLDPSPSGGGPINVQPNILPTSAPGQIGAPPPLRPGTPPKARMPYEYMHPASGPRHSQFSQNPPYGYQGQPSQAYMQPAYQYEPGSQPPPSLHQPPHSVAQPVHVIPGSVIDDQQYNNPDSEPARSSSFEPEGEQDEESGEFGGLVSYFSSQREDDLET